MIFSKTWQKVLDGTKTQTRRLVKDGDFFNGWSVASKWQDDVYPMHPRFVINRTYAIQPGRGQKAVGRIRITGIRREQLQDISDQDAIAEGFPAKNYLFGSAYSPIWGFRQLWDSIHRSGAHWEDNPEVWVLEFEID